MEIAPPSAPLEHQRLAAAAALQDLVVGRGLVTQVGLAAGQSPVGLLARTVEPEHLDKDMRAAPQGLPTTLQVVVDLAVWVGTTVHLRAATAALERPLPLRGHLLPMLQAGVAALTLAPLERRLRAAVATPRRRGLHLMALMAQHSRAAVAAVRAALGRQLRMAALADLAQLLSLCLLPITQATPLERSL